jgi:hypothetical protein
VGEIAMTGPVHRRSRLGAKIRTTSLIGVLTLAVLLVWSPSGAAGPKRVEGGGSFADAPVLIEGSYRDTIRPTETLFYGVELGSGQRLRAKVVLQPHGDESALADILRLRVYDPARAEISSDLDELSFAGPSVLRAGKLDPFEEDAYESAGIYYVAFSMPDQFDRLRRRSLYRFRLEIDVRGVASPSTPSPTPTVTFSPSPQPSPTMAGPPPAESEGVEPYLQTGAIAFAIGALLGAARRLLWG